MKLANKAILNAFAGLTMFVTKIGINFILTPVLVTSFGSTLFGVWSVLNRLSSYLTAVDGRSTQALKFYIANSQYSNDDVQKRQAVGSAIGVWFVFLPLLLVCGSIIVWLSPIVTGALPNIHHIVRTTSAILVVTFIISGLVEIPAAVLRGMNMEFRRLGLVVGLTIAGGIATWVLVKNGGGLPTVALVQLSVAVLTGFGIYRFVRIHVQWFGVMRPKQEDLIKFIKLSAWFLLWILAFKLLMESDMVVLAMVGSADAVTSYALTAMTITAVSSVLRIIVAATTPGLGGIVGQGNFERANQLRNECLLLCWGLVTLAGVLLLALNASFVGLWVGYEHYAGWKANMLLVLSLVQFTMLYFDGLVIDVTLDLKKKVLLSLVSGLISLIFAVILIPAAGITGLCIALILGRLPLTFAYPNIVHNFFGKTGIPCTWVWIRRSIITGVLFMAGYFFDQNIPINRWHILFFWSVILSILATIVILTIGLSSKERKSVKQRFVGILADMYKG